MKKRIILLTSVLFLFIVNLAFSQSGKNKVKIDITSFDPKGIPISDLSALLDTTTSIFNKYVNYGSIIDKKGKPNPKYLIKFKNLFATNSKVVNDFLKRPGDLINYEKYIEFAELFLEYDGIIFDIENAKIESISTDDNYYRINIRFNKLMHQGLDKEGYYTKYKRPFKYDLTLTFTISKVTMENPEIVRITGHNLIVPIPKKESFAGAFFTYGLPKMKGTNSDFLLPNSLGITNMLSGKSQLSFGADYMRNITGGKSIYWNIGLRMNILNFNMQSDTTISYHQNMSYDGVVDYDRIVRIHSNASNSTTINSISLPIGLSYRIDKGRLHTLFVGAGIMPSFIIGVSQNFKGSFSREIDIEGYEPLVKEFDNGQTNCNGQSNLNSGLAYNPKIKGYTMSGNLSLKYLYKYQYNQSIALIFNYKIDLTPVLPNASEIFLGENSLPDDRLNINTSFTQSVYKDIKSNVISFGVAWYYNFKSKGLLF